jgi:exodeoxyribonuclease III
MPPSTLPSGDGNPYADEAITDSDIQNHPLTIATWNVNSIKARLSAVCSWIEQNSPTVLCLQELKCETDRFPYKAFQDLGYEAIVHGQKSYNGVAILHHGGAANINYGLPGDEEDYQARCIEATINGVHILCLYAPNGNPVLDQHSTQNVLSEKYRYKLSWMARLRDRLSELLKSGMPIAACGDYNVIPQAMDCYDPAAWKDDALFLPETRRAFRSLEHIGYYDAFRALHPTQGGAYTFWDYQAGAWQHNHGIRIDHAMLSPQAADKLSRAWIDIDPRGREKSSDHTPLIIELR